MMMMNDTIEADRPQAADTIRVYIAEDHRMVLWGLQRMVESAWPRMTLAGTAATVDALMEDPAVAAADVLLLDLDLAGQCSLDALPALRRRTAARVILVTGSEDGEMYREAVLRGVRGVLHKSAAPEMLLRAIEKVAAGELWLRQELLGEVFGRLTGDGTPAERKSPDDRRIESLTQRERDVVAALVRHAGAKQLVIADALDMSEHTLRNHLTTIYNKLGVRGRLELHLFATHHGLARAA